MQGMRGHDLDDVSETCANGTGSSSAARDRPRHEPTPTTNAHPAFLIITKEVLLQARFHT
jgi:hypothetical protein